MDSLNDAIERARNLERGVQTFRQQLQRKPKYGTDVWVQQANLYKIPVNADGSFGPNIEHPRVTYTQELHDAVVAKLATLGVDTEGLKEELKYPDWKRRFPISDSWPTSDGGNAFVRMTATQMIDFGDYLAVGYYVTLTKRNVPSVSDKEYAFASIQARRKTTIAKTVEYVTEITTGTTDPVVLNLGGVWPYLDLDGSTVRGIGVCWLNTSTNVFYRKHKTISSGVEASNNLTLTFDAQNGGNNYSVTVVSGDLWLWTWDDPQFSFPRRYEIDYIKVDTSEAASLGVTATTFTGEFPEIAGGYQFAGMRRNLITDGRYAALFARVSSGTSYTTWIFDSHTETHTLTISAATSALGYYNQCTNNSICRVDNVLDRLSVSGPAGGFNHPYFDFTDPFTSRVMGRHSFYTDDVANPTNDPETIIGITSNGYSIAGPWQNGATAFDLVLSSAASSAVKSRCTLYNVDKDNAEITRQALNAEVTGLNVSGNDVIVYQQYVIGQISDIYEGGIITYQQS